MIIHPNSISSLLTLQSFKLPRVFLSHSAICKYYFYKFGLQIIRSYICQIEKINLPPQNLSKLNIHSTVIYFLNCTIPQLRQLIRRRTDTFVTKLYIQILYYSFSFDKLSYLHNKDNKKRDQNYFILI